MHRVLIIDLDGTTIPNRQDGLPSQGVIEAIAHAQTRLTVAIATGRPWPDCKHIFWLLQINAPSIISGGTEIIDPITEVRLWQKSLSSTQVEAVMLALRAYPHQLFVGDEPASTLATTPRVMKPENIIFVMAVKPIESPAIVESLASVPDLAVHVVRSWTLDHFDIHISHREATKKHAVEELLRILQVEKKNAVAVGDSNNDLPLFASVGYKIAMGNATHELKREADWIAPEQSQGGLVAAIAKILSH